MTDKQSISHKKTNLPAHGRSGAFRRRLNRVRLSFIAWQRRKLSPLSVTLMLALIIGVLTGISAVSLKKLVKFFNVALLDGINFGAPNVQYLIWPLLGIFITMVFQQYVVRKRFGRCTHVVREHISTKDYDFNSMMVFNPVVGCSLTMGFGASGGTEGPVALSGAAIGSVLGRWFALPQSSLKVLVGIGAGAGIAAIFKSPVGGVLFTLEVLQMEISTIPVLALIVASLVASTTAYALSNFSFDIYFDKHMPMDAHWFLWVILLGVFCGLYSAYYSYSKQKAMRIFLNIRRPWLAALISGGVLSVSVFAFPVLFGEGFELIRSLVNADKISFVASGAFSDINAEWWVIVAPMAILLLKGILVAASNCGGGVAGDFVPTLFAGCVAGFLFATVVNSLTGANLPVWYFSLIAMGAVMAGTLKAPLMAIFILCEATDTYVYLFPYMVAVAISYIIVRLLSKFQIAVAD